MDKECIGDVGDGVYSQEILFERRQLDRTKLFDENVEEPEDPHLIRLRALPETDDLAVSHIEKLNLLPKDLNLNGTMFRLKRPITVDNHRDLYFTKEAVTSMIVGQKQNFYRDVSVDSSGISLNDIIEKVCAQRHYETDDVIEDVKMLYRQARTNSKSERVFELIKTLYTELVYEFRAAKECRFCVAQYYLIKKSFAIPCPKPHLLVWAIVDGYGWWPGKVMFGGKDNVRVQLFGTLHDQYWFPYKKCFLLTNYCRFSDECDYSSHEEALAELRNHLWFLLYMHPEMLKDQTTESTDLEPHMLEVERTFPKQIIHFAKNFIDRDRSRFSNITYILPEPK